MTSTLKINVYDASDHQNFTKTEQTNYLFTGKLNTLYISTGREVTYGAVMEVERVYPAMDVVSRWELTDQNGREVVCVDIPVTIVNEKIKENHLFYN